LQELIASGDDETPSRLAANTAIFLPGTNVDLEKVEHSITIIDARALAIASAGGNRTQVLANWSAKSWSRRREAFEDLWKGGRSFIYLSPNPGTLGATYYGEYCLVIDANRVSKHADSAVFRFDSAQRYRRHGKRGPTACLAEAGSWESRADVAVVELAVEVTAQPERQWPDLICGKDGYLEVVTVGTIDVGDVVRLHISSQLPDELDDLWWELKADPRRITDPVSLRRAKAYDTMLTWPNLQIRII
jgi:hypothetical protein